MLKPKFEDDPALRSGITIVNEIKPRRDYC